MTQGQVDKTIQLGGRMRAGRRRHGQLDPAVGGGPGWPVPQRASEVPDGVRRVRRQRGDAVPRQNRGGRNLERTKYNLFSHRNHNPAGYVELLKAAYPKIKSIHQ